MANFKSKGGELRFVDFVDEDHWREVHRTIAAAGIDLGAFRDPAQSKFPEVKRLAQSRVTMSTERWQQSVRELCGQVVEAERAIDADTPYGFCGFGLAIPNPTYAPPVAREVEGGGLMVSYGREPKLHWFGEEHLVKGILPVTFMPLHDMAVTLQYRECI